MTGDVFEIEYDLQVVYGGSGDKYPDYEGDYDVTPKVGAQVLSTSHKSMTSDLTINEIPYQETTNLGGGVTVNIAFD